MAFSGTVDELMTSFSTPPVGLKSTKFYGVQIPGRTEERPIVLQKLPVTKTFLAVCPSVRFKEFSSEEEAADYSQFRCPIVTDHSFRRVIEPRSRYPNPSQVDREALLLALTTGNVAAVHRLAWKNPRLLITSDDGPQCYKGTWRQTVLHLAVQAQNFPLFCTLLEIIENPLLAEYTRLTEFENLEERRTAIVRNYLNNRTKKEESVLDCAVIYGCVEIVDFLTVHPLCDTKMSRRDGLSLKTVVCSKSGKTEDKVAISEILDGRWYIPVFCASNIFQEAVIGEPVSVTEAQDLLRSGKVVGLLGPIAGNLASEMFDYLQSSHRHSLNAAHKSRSNSISRRKIVHGNGDNVSQDTIDKAFVSDEANLFTPEKRTAVRTMRWNEERCRLLAKEHKLKWREWWSFLQSFVDISSVKGLTKLEAFLSSQFYGKGKVGQAELDDRPELLLSDLDLVEVLSLHYSRGSSNSSAVSLSESSEPMDDSLDDPDDVYYTPPESPEPVEESLNRFCSSYSSVKRGFIGRGEAPSIMDHEVYEVLKKTDIPNDFRYVLAWGSLMQRRCNEEDLVAAFSRFAL